MNANPYMILAKHLDALPNGYPATEDGSELKILEKLFNPEEAAIAGALTPQFESVEQIAGRLSEDLGALRQKLKAMSRRGLIDVGMVDQGLGFRLLPFVVGIYENQVGTLDAELATLVERYFKNSFSDALRVQPQFHRIIPVGESIRNSIEVQPFESAYALLENAKAWGVLDCICRKQKALIGEPCGHPIEVCMVLDDRPNVFDNNQTIKALTLEQAKATLKIASDSGLVHSVSNNQHGVHYICNCCTCSCGILRGMATLGMANVIARSAFVNKVDAELCNGCGVCVDVCMFDALSVNDILEINQTRCVGCGVCVERCDIEAIGLVRRSEDEILPIPETLESWGTNRLAARGM